VSLLSQGSRPYSSSLQGSIQAPSIFNFQVLYKAPFKLHSSSFQDSIQAPLKLYSGSIYYYIGTPLRLYEKECHALGGGVQKKNQCMPGEVSADTYKEALCCDVVYHRALPRLPLVLCIFLKNTYNRSRG
jgi:hypothetical protein